jgi:hypothetical protein
MAEQTFTAGQVLTAAQMTTLQNNIGLAWISSTTVGSAQSSVVVSGCFTSTYDNYRIIYAGGTQSSQNRFSMVLGASATGYYEGLQFVSFATGTPGNASTNNGVNWTYIAGGNTASTGFIIDLQNPFLAQYTQMNAVGALQTNQATWDQGIHAVATSFTGFTIAPVGSTITGGTISIYGYRK